MRTRILAMSALALFTVAACSEKTEDTIDSLPMLTAVASTTGAPMTDDTTTTTTPKLEDEFYLIQQGDSLSAIASSFGVKLETLMAVNGITNPDKIQAGQKLIIPSGGAPTTTSVAPADPNATSTTPAP